jgi:hypothetical protein
MNMAFNKNFTTPTKIVIPTNFITSHILGENPAQNKDYFPVLYHYEQYLNNHNSFQWYFASALPVVLLSKLFTAESQ